jgi:hypothetical protein
MAQTVLEPDRNQIEIFVDAIFRRVSTGFISLRSFYEGEDKVFGIMWVPRNATNFHKYLCDVAEDLARRAAQNPKAVVFAPPLCAFSNKDKAGEEDVAEGLTLSVECDENPEAARAILEPLLGPVTVAVRSGGIWQSNGASYAKQHLHWRLHEPARKKEQLAKLKRAREIACHLVGADPTTAPICHPLRWPGSWHRKSTPQPCEIIIDASDINHEIDLDEALKVLEPLAPPAPAAGIGAHAVQPGGDWGELADKIVRGENLHKSITRLAMKMLKGGTPEVMAVQILRGLLEASKAPRDERWENRYDSIPRAVSSATRKLEAQVAPSAGNSGGAPPPLPPPAGPTPQPGSGSGGAPPPPPPGASPAAPVAGPSPVSAPSQIEDTMQTFESWLILPNRTPVYAMLGTIAANLLPGDPVWLGLVAPPSSAKTELLNSVSGLPFAVSVSTLTLASLLSGTPRRQQARGATGGLLRQVSNPGLLCLKDFTSTLTMRPDSKAEVLSALREIYDGKWTRYIGTDGGKPLHWEGKLGLVFGCTGAIDTQHSVSDALGNRFLLSRMEPGKGQLRWSLRHVGGKTAAMRQALVESVNLLFIEPRPDPQELSEQEIVRFERVTELVVRLRGAVARDGYRRDLEMVFGAEGPARLGLSLEARRRAQNSAQCRHLGRAR